MTVLDGRFVALIGSCFVSLAAGTPYLYGVYSPQLMSNCGFSASDSSIFSFATNIGSSIGGLPAGLFIDRYGTRISIFVGAICECSGFLILYISYQYKLHHFWLLFFAMVCIGLGSVLSYFSTLKAATANFPNHRGTASALPVSSYGLSALIYSAIAAFCFGGNTGGLLRFITVFAGVLIGGGSFFVKVVVNEEPHQLDEELGNQRNGKSIVNSGELSTTSPKPIKGNSDEDHGYGTFLMGHRGSFANIDMVRNNSVSSLFSMASQYSQSTTSLSSSSSSSFRPSSIPITASANNQDGLFIRGAYDASPFRSYGNSPSNNYFSKSSLSSSPLTNYNSNNNNNNNGNTDGSLIRSSSFIKHSFGSSSPSTQRGLTNSNLTSSIKKTGSFVYRGQSSFTNNNNSPRGSGMPGLGFQIPSRKSFRNESDASAAIDEETPILNSASSTNLNQDYGASITNTGQNGNPLSSSPASSNSMSNMLYGSASAGNSNNNGTHNIPATANDTQQPFEISFPSTAAKKHRSKHKKKEKFTSLSHVKSLITNKFFLSHYVLNSVYCANGQVYIFCVGFIVRAQLNAKMTNSGVASTPDVFMDSLMDPLSNTPGVINQILRFYMRNKNLVNVLNCINLTFAASGITPFMPMINPNAFVITEGKDLSSAYQALQVSIVSFSNFLGRFIAGPASDLIHKRMKMQRIWVLVFSLVLMAFGHFNLIYLDDVGSLSLSSFLIGSAYGSAYGTYPAVAADYFGTKGFTTTWGLLGTGSIISFLILSSYFGRVYDTHSDLIDGVKICYEGKLCYNSVFKLTTSLCGLLFIGFSIVLYIKRK